MNSIIYMEINRLATPATCAMVKCYYNAILHSPLQHFNVSHCQLPLSLLLLAAFALPIALPCVYIAFVLLLSGITIAVYWGFCFHLLLSLSLLAALTPTRAFPPACRMLHCHRPVLLLSNINYYWCLPLLRGLHYLATYTHHFHIYWTLLHLALQKKSKLHNIYIGAFDLDFYRQWAEGQNQHRQWQGTVRHVYSD